MFVRQSRTQLRRSIARPAAYTGVRQTAAGAGLLHEEILCRGAAATTLQTLRVVKRFGTLQSAPLVFSPSVQGILFTQLCRCRSASRQRWHARVQRLTGMVQTSSSMLASSVSMRRNSGRLAFWRHWSVMREALTAWGRLPQKVRVGSVSLGGSVHILSLLERGPAPPLKRYQFLRQTEA